MSGDCEWGDRCPVCRTPWVEDGVQDTPPEYCTACYSPWAAEGAAEDEDRRSPWERGRDDCFCGVFDPPYPPEDQDSIREWKAGWQETSDAGWGNAGTVKFHRGMDARYRGLPRDEFASEQWLDGWDTEDRTGKMRRAKAARDGLCADELVVTSDLAFLHRAFQAGNHDALLDAMELCTERCFPPPRWMAEATASLLKKVGTRTYQYHGRVRDLTRFLAVESLRCRNSPRQWQALTGASLEELAEWLASEKYESDPGYHLAIARATQTVQHLRDNVDGQSVQKSHAKVKKDLREHGNNSQYITGIDVADILHILEAEDFVAEVEATIYNRDFIPFRTDMLE